MKFNLQIAVREMTPSEKPPSYKWKACVSSHCWDCLEGTSPIVVGSKEFSNYKTLKQVATWNPTAKTVKEVWVCRMLCLRSFLLAPLIKLTKPIFSMKGKSRQTRDKNWVLTNRLLMFYFSFDARKQAWLPTKAKSWHLRGSLWNWTSQQQWSWQ